MKVQIRHLGDGAHSFKDTVKSADLELDDSIFKGDVRVQGEVEKIGDTYHLRFSIATPVWHSCDRCLVEFESMVDGRCSLIYAADPELDRDDDTIRIIDSTQPEIDISNELRETALLAIPFKLICKENCKGLCSTCGENLNHAHCSCNKRPSDPRWDALRNL